MVMIHNRIKLIFYVHINNGLLIPDDTQTIFYFLSSFCLSAHLTHSLLALFSKLIIFSISLNLEQIDLYDIGNCNLVLDNWACMYYKLFREGRYLIKTINSDGTQSDHK